ncbi:MAG: hypothetical protein AAF830_13920, partial [Pseudomonadota bacterium]
MKAAGNNAAERYNAISKQAEPAGIILNPANIDDKFIAADQLRQIYNSFNALSSTREYTALLPKSTKKLKATLIY